MKKFLLAMVLAVLLSISIQSCGWMYTGQAGSGDTTQTGGGAVLVAVAEGRVAVEQVAAELSEPYINVT